METLKQWVEDRQENGDDGTGYEFTEGEGDTITCDDCSTIAEDWFSNEHAICKSCYVLRQKEKESEQVVCGDCLYPISKCGGCQS